MAEVLAVLSANRYITEMLIACFVVAYPHKKRKHYRQRLLIFGIVTEMGSLVIMHSGAVQNVWKNPAYIVVNCWVYMLCFSLTALIYFRLLCLVSWKEAVYCMTLSMAAQHISSSFYILLEVGIPVNWMALQLCMWCSATLCTYLIVYHLCLKPICQEGVYQFRVQNLTSATFIIFIVSAIISAFGKSFDVTGRSPLLLICQIYEIFCCIFLLWLQVSQRKALDLQHVLDIQDYLQHVRQEQFVQSRKEVALTNHFMHELIHQIAKMKVDDNEETNLLFIDIAENLSVYEKVETNNETINTAIRERSLYCKANHINWMCIVDENGLDFIKSTDLYLIFRNALDNAIDSVCTLPEIDSRVIDIKVFHRNQMLMIQIENPFYGSLKYEEGLPVTTKGDTEYYGYGLKTIKTIVKQYDGWVSVTSQNNRFKLHIVIPLPQTVES